MNFSKRKLSKVRSKISRGIKTSWFEDNLLLKHEAYLKANRERAMKIVQSALIAAMNMSQIVIIRSDVRLSKEEKALLIAETCIDSAQGIAQVLSPLA